MLAQGWIYYAQIIVSDIASLIAKRSGFLNTSVTIFLFLAAGPHARLHAALEVLCSIILGCSYINVTHRMLVDMVSDALIVHSSCNFLCIHVDAAVVANDWSSFLG